jgi:anti-sigma regulatory factor (Ser/Thr protein kinase)
MVLNVARMTVNGHYIRLELPSSFEWLDLVQLLSDRVAGLAGLDEDGHALISVAVRESVINAIKHGNKEEDAKGRDARIHAGTRQHVGI